MSKVHAVDTTGSLDGTVADREDHTVTAMKRHDLGSRLHPRPLLGQHKLTARIILTMAVGDVSEHSVSCGEITA